MSLYPTSLTPSLAKAVFAAPGPEYRGAPFWSWNGRLDRDRLLRQSGWLAEMGLGGWHIHPRTGLETPYLGAEFLDHVKACVEDGRKRGGLRTWLYDEDRWPSGFAGGLVTQDPALRARHLLFTPQGEAPAQAAGTISCAIGGRSGQGTLLARYGVRLDEQGRLASYRRLADGAQAVDSERIWYAIQEVAQPTSWFNGQTYVDTMNPAATRRFVAVTHEPYRAAVGKDFGGLVPAIFTDEPQFTRKSPLPSPHALADVVLPWTADLVDSHVAAFGADPLDTLPEVVWDLAAGAPSEARWRYHEHTAERFAAAYADVIGEWCQRHGIAMTGHLMEEHSLEAQCHATGESMRSYRGFQIPGLDLLCDQVEITTAKQAQSAKHQYGREGMLSELYGVTDWDFPFAGHKRQGDWQAALGVTVRVHHLSWMSMKGEAKRDYPASIHYQSPWFREYPAVEDHFARVNSVLTRGRPHVRVAVVHPIESFWLGYGPRSTSAAIRETQERTFQEVASWLVRGTIDFDYLAESLLPGLCPQGGAPLVVGAMQYDAVVVPPLRTIRSSTLERLEAFAAAGGRVVFLGEAPALVDCRPSPRAVALAARGERVSCDRAALLAALAPVRDVDVLRAQGEPAGTVMTQLRAEGDSRHLFVCNPVTDESLPGARIRLRGSWSVRLLDTLDGTVRELPVIQEGGWSEIVCDLPACGSLLLTFDPAVALARPILPTAASWSELGRLDGAVPVSLSEPNVLLLDQAEWRLGDGPWQPREEILRLDNLARRALGLGDRDGNIAQPWTDTAPTPVLGRIALRFRIRCEVAVQAPRLALEDRGTATIHLDGVPVPTTDVGWWTDEDLRLVALPDLAPGEHQLVIEQPYHRQTGLEWHYLLGNFGVRVEGRETVVTRPVRSLWVGDWCAQGLPFFGGNVTYHIPITATGIPLRLALPRIGGPLASVALDGRPAGRIWLPHWRLELGTLAAGAHELAVTVFGNRRNCFGAIHCPTRPRNAWWGPDSWRTTGDEWAYEYALRPMGLLTAPVLEGR